MLDMHATSEVGHTVTLRHTQHCSCDPSCSHTHREEAACPRPACTTGSQRLCVLFGLAQLKDCTDACFCKSLSSFSNREVSREITVNFVNPLEKDQQESPDSNRYLHTRFGVNKHLLDCKTRVLNSRLEQLLMFGLQEVSAIKKKLTFNGLWSSAFENSIDKTLSTQQLQFFISENVVHLILSLIIQKNIHSEGLAY